MNDVIANEKNLKQNSALFCFGLNNKCLADNQQCNNFRKRATTRQALQHHRCIVAMLRKLAQVPSYDSHQDYAGLVSSAKNNIVSIKKHSLDNLRSICMYITFVNLKLSLPIRIVRNPLILNT